MILKGHLSLNPLPWFSFVMREIPVPMVGILILFTNIDRRHGELLLFKGWFVACPQASAAVPGLLRQRLSLSLRREWQRRQTHQEYQAHGHAGVPHRLRISAEHVLGEIAERERSRRRRQTPYVV